MAKDIRSPKQIAIEKRHRKVYTLFLLGAKEIEIAEQLKVDRKTIYTDLQVIKDWPEERQVTFKALRTDLQKKINELVKEQALLTFKIRNPTAKFHMLQCLIDELTEMWKKLMPTEIRIEGVEPLPPISVQVQKERREKMQKRAPKPNHKS